METANASSNQPGKNMEFMLVYSGFSLSLCTRVQEELISAEGIFALLHYCGLVLMCVGSEHHCISVVDGCWWARVCVGAANWLVQQCAVWAKERTL